MTCPLCGARRARRACPALNQQICPVCCGTKRLTEIRCPSDCSYLSTAREHPAAVVVRRQQRDFGRVMQIMRDFNERQSQLFLVTAACVTRYQPPDLQTLIDDDVTEAASALAGTFETASRGVIYEHRPASVPAARLAAALKKALVESAASRTSAFERDAAVVLRRVEEAARDLRAAAPGERRGFIDLLERMTRPSEDAPADAGKAEPEPPRLIVP